MLTVNEVTYAPRGLGPLSLELASGQVVLLCGPSGSGKSTLCQLVAGELEPTSGSLWDQRERPPCGYLTADVESQLLGSTVAQELELGRRAGANRPAPAEALVCAANSLLASFHGRQAEDPQSLSAGEQQLLLLTSLALGSFRLLILDEGLSCLDQVSFQAVCRALRALAAGGSLILIVSHELRLLPWVDRCVGLAGGRVVFESATAELTWGQLSEVDMWLGTVTSGDHGEPVLRSVRQVAVSPATRFSGGPSGPQFPLVEFGGDAYTLGEGEVLALAGVSGCGKSRLLATLAGLDCLEGWKRQAQVYAVLLPQKASSVLWHRNLGAEFEASLAQGRRRNTTMAISDLSEIPPAWLARSGRSFSQGETKLLACLCLLLQQPDLLLLDEPFSGLDAHLRALLEGRLRDFLGRGGRLVFTTHHPDEMVLYPSRLLVLDAGAPVWHGSALDYFAAAPNPELGSPGLPFLAKF